MDLSAIRFIYLCLHDTGSRGITAAGLYTSNRLAPPSGVANELDFSYRPNGGLESRRRVVGKPLDPC